MALTLAACSLQNVKLYEGPDRADTEHATLSSIGRYPERELALMVVEIDGKSIPTGRAASYLLLPGSYQIKVEARKNLRVTTGLGVKYKYAAPVSSLVARAGHTYVPNAIVAGDYITIFFEDKGASFPRECLPLYQAVNESGGNPGLALYRTEKKCER